MAEKNNQTKKNPGKVHSQAENLMEQALSSGVLFLSDWVRDISKDVIQILPEDSARRHQMVVFGQEEGVIKVAMAHPQNIDALNVLRFIEEQDQLASDIYLASSEHINKMLDQYGGAEIAVQEVVKLLKTTEFSKKAVEEEELGGSRNESYQSAPVAKLVRVIVRHGIEGKASDIHLEPVDVEYRVRFRVDGVLHTSLIFPLEVGRAVVARIKILSNLKIDEKRKPQDGRFKMKEDERTVDFRVSTLPVVEGEKVVIRVLDRNSDLTNPKGLGMYGRNTEIFGKSIEETFGIILITGPTGSGKSTTLYTLLQLLNNEERNIITLEDPVEYYMAGINQSQVRPEIGYTFASGLRSILRQDPNVIMVGEIRDPETAELAIHAALTGHLVLSTLHTNDALGAVPRLIDMKVEPFLISAAVRVVAAQRLVRKICPDCKEEHSVSKLGMEMITEEIRKIPREEFAKYGIDITKPIKTYKGRGCAACDGTGLKGRLAIYEALEINDDIKLIIEEKHGNENEIWKVAQKNNMTKMKQDGILKVIMGLTTLEEVERVTEGSHSVGGDVGDDTG